MLSPEPWIPLCLKDFPWPCQALPLTTKRGFINTDTAAWKEGMSRETDPTMRSWLSHEVRRPCSAPAPDLSCIKRQAVPSGAASWDPGCMLPR